MAIRWIDESDLENPTHPDAGFAVEWASWLLYKLTAEKYAGVRESTEWYGYARNTCFPSCLDNHVRSHLHLYLDSVCASDSQHLRLRHKPVHSISSVKIGGEPVASPSASYYVVNNAYLAARNGAMWQLDRGVEVTYSHGMNPPVAGKLAAMKLANALVNAFISPSECRLPERVTSISRQGVSYTLLDPQDFLKEGRTGIYEVDLFIKVANPAGANRKPRVFSPDTPRGERRT